MKPLAKCGTRSGYNRHLKLKEKVCQECRDAQNIYDRKRFYENPEIKRERNKKHRNPEKRRSAWRKRNALINGNKVERYSEKDVLNLYGTSCYLCSEEINLSASRRSGIGKDWEFGLNIDHVIPISFGGPDTLENVRPTHVLCNIKKGNRNVDKTDYS
jgi:5-methylcytosine-specific restriction endonuclease McrA